MNDPNHVLIEAGDLPEDLTDVACKLLYFVSPRVASVRRLAETRQLEVRVESGEARAIADDARRLLDRLKQGYRPLSPRTLFSHGEPGATAAGGARALTEHLAREGWARRHGAGLWAFGPRFVALVEALDALLLETARSVYGADAHSFPSLIATSTLRQAGYLESFPQNAGFVSHLPQDLATLVAFQEANAAEDAEAVFPDRAATGPPQECLPPAVCYQHFRDLAGTTLHAGSIITARGPCFRYEARHNMDDLARLWSFQMREIVYVGSESFVAGQAERGPGVFEQLLDRLELAGWCETATDPFFVNAFGSKRYAQVASDLKFELRLPLGGGESLAAASLNRHQDHFGKAFAIHLPGGAAAVSGCTGFGLERLALGFLARHGLAEARWPDAVAQASTHVAPAR